MRIQRTPLIAALVILGLMLLGCAGGLPSPSGGVGGTISSTDGKCQIQTPSGWVKRTDLHDSAGLQAANTKENSYIIVLSEPKSDFAPKYTYQQYNQLTTNRFMQNVKNAKINRGPKDVTINGRPAIQHEMEGFVENLHVMYLRTTIDGEDTFHQVLAWTIYSKADTNRALLEQLTNSFQETKTALPKK